MNKPSDIIFKELTIAKNEIINRLKSSNRVASGETNTMFEVEVVNDKRVDLIGPTYAYELEHGRGPGKIPYNFVHILMDWIRTKGLAFTSDEELERWAYAIAWKTAREGSYSYRYGITYDIFQTPFTELQNRLEDELAAYWTAQLISIYDNKQ